jgi:hypothetical protein
MRWRTTWVLFHLGMFALTSSAAPPRPMVRASIEGPKPIIVGEQVRLNVEVLVPNYFTTAPQFPEIDVKNALVVSPGDRPEHTVETVGNDTFAGIRVHYLIYPEQTGTFQIPAAVVSVKYALEPPKATQVELPLPQLRFEAVIPAEAGDLDYFLPTTRLKITQKIDRPLTNIKVGDTFTRTVVVDGSKLRAMLIPPVSFATQDGLTVYIKQPVVEDLSDERSSFREGRRTDSATYLVRKAGEYRLPGYAVRWWNLEHRRLETASVAPLSFTVQAAPVVQPDMPPEAAPQKPDPKAEMDFGLIGKRLFWIAVGLILLWAVWLLIGRLLEHWKRYRLEREHSESTLRKKLVASCRSSDARATYRLLLEWKARRDPHLSLADFASQSGDHAMQSEIEVLTAALYREACEKEWSGTELARIVARSVNRFEPMHRRPASYLPELNPKD